MAQVAADDQLLLSEHLKKNLHNSRPVFQVSVTPVALAETTLREEDAVPTSATCFLLLPSSWGEDATQPGQSAEKICREYRIEITSCPAPTEETSGTDREKEIETATSKNGSNVALCNTQMRFSEFYRRFAYNKNDSYAFRRLEDSWRCFPSRGCWWDNYTTDETNVQQRAKRMQSYIDRVWNYSWKDPYIFASKSMQSALDLSEETQEYLQKLAQADKQAQMRLKQERTDNIMREQRQRAAKKQERWEMAQSLKLGQRGETLVCSPLPTLLFPVAMTFQVDVPFFNGTSGNISIREDGKTWFDLRRKDYPQLFPGANLTNHLMTARGPRSILVIREVFRILDYKCELFYLNQDGTYRPDSKVTIHRHFQFAIPQEEYTITSSSRPNQRFECAGTFGHIRVIVDGTCAATLSNDFLSPSYCLKIGAGHDHVLLLGIACAIVRIRALIKANSNSHGSGMMMGAY